MKKIKRERLKRLADGLENYKEWSQSFVAPKSFEGKLKKVNFDINIWVEPCEDFCKTSACAVGSACLDPWFQEQGLKVKDGEPYYKGAYEMDACEKFFGLTFEEAYDIFTDNGYIITSIEKIKPKMVAKKIRNFLNGNYD